MRISIHTPHKPRSWEMGAEWVGNRMGNITDHSLLLD